MADTSNFMIEQCLVSVWVHEKGQLVNCVKKWEKTSFFMSTKQLQNLRKKTFLTRSMLDEKHSRRPKKYCGNDVKNCLNDSLEHLPMKSSNKELDKMEIPRTSLHRWVKNQGFINEFSHRDVEVQCDACENFLSALSTLCIVKTSS